MKGNKNDIINIEEIHKVQANMLRELVEFLKKNDITYYLDYGTLIGVVRHKGFIPWDDDIDISMPRPEYEKLMNIAKKNKNMINQKLYVTSLELGNSVFPFCKIYNTEYGVKEEVINVEDGEFLWIDIFPYDGLSGNDKKDLKLIKHIHLWHTLLITRLGSCLGIYKISKTFYKGIIKVIMKIFINIFPPEFYAKKMRKWATKNRYENSDIVQNVVWVSRLYKGIPKEELEKTVLLEFEDDQYFAIESYDEYLKSIYGNYMQLPPEDERKTHFIKIWKIEDEENEK